MSSEITSNKPIKFRTKDVESEETSMLSFDEMYLSKQVMSGLKSAGYLKPSPIQLKAIPLGKLGLDLIVQAKSGTGKTCVFSVIALEHVLASHSKSLQVLILAPTREVATQIDDVIKAISVHSSIKSNAFIGGQLLKQDKTKLKPSGCQIAVGTPGRILHLISSEILNTANIRLFILDEADKLLAPEFQESINLIFSKLSDNKQIIMASATYPSYMAAYATRYMRTPTWVRLNAVDPSLRGIRQYYKITAHSDMPNANFDFKVDSLIQFLSTISFVQAIVFINYQIKGESLCKSLNEKGWPTIFISGNIEQKERNEAMIQLKQFKCKILVSTDLTSRGIDASNVDLVICMDLPADPETYLHRIGRAGRYGSQGIAVSFITEGEESAQFEHLIDSYELKIQQIGESVEDIILSHNETKRSIEVDDITVEKASITKEQLDYSLLEYENFKNQQKYLQTHRIDSKNQYKKAIANKLDEKENEFRELTQKHFKSFEEIRKDFDQNKTISQMDLRKSLTTNQNNLIKSDKNLFSIEQIKSKLINANEYLNKLFEREKDSKVKDISTIKKQKEAPTNLNELYKWQSVDKENHCKNETLSTGHGEDSTGNAFFSHSDQINYLNYYSYYYKLYFNAYLDNKMNK